MRLLFIILLACFSMTLQASSKSSRFEAGKGMFMLNERPFVIKAAELHYPRIPRPYWEHRIQMCKALGMNTICIYVFWNVHEPKPGEFDFDGQNNLREFIELCDKNDMKVILRPGPYVCAEWEMGGLPWWLLQKKDIRLRENDPWFLERVKQFQEKLADNVKGLTIADGGPIIMVQVENEYGSYGVDKEYLSNIREIMRKNFGKDVVLFQCDWSSNFWLNGLDDLIWTVNFGTGANIDEQFKKLREMRPETPLMCSEFWSGWFDKWGDGHETRPAEEMIAGIDEMLSNNISFSLYMTHGGTNWGHWAGANSPGYAPDVTSYDYDAPISESGRATPKYYLLRKTLAKYTSTDSLSEIPAEIPSMAIKPFHFNEVAPLFNNLPSPIKADTIRTMEEYGQGFGSILYSTTIPQVSDGSILEIMEPHDYARIFVNGECVGTLDRRRNEHRLRLPSVAEGSRLDILVEAMGRINFGRAIKDFKGITERVTLYNPGNSDGLNLTGWKVYNLEDTPELYSSMDFIPLDSVCLSEEGRLPAGVYRTTFNLDRTDDTFLNFETWGKGLVYVNSHPLGRIWEIGPQQTLYMPGCWLNVGENEILVFDILGPKVACSEGLETPILNKLQLSVAEKSNSGRPDVFQLKPAITASFDEGNGWQRRSFDNVADGRYLIIEAIDAIDGRDYAAISEFYLLDENGKRLSREQWTVCYVDSEDLFGGNHSASKLFDLQESTFWASEVGTKYPYIIMIDLGEKMTVKGLEYLPRMEKDAPGAIRNFKVYLKN